MVTFPSGRRMSKWMADTGNLPHSERATARSKTFPGIADAMANQWTPNLNVSASEDEEEIEVVDVDAVDGVEVDATETPEQDEE